MAEILKEYEYQDNLINCMKEAVGRNPIYLHFLGINYKRHFNGEWEINEQGIWTECVNPLV